MFEPGPVGEVTHKSVNGANLLALADAIENDVLNIGFDMREWNERSGWSAQYEDYCNTVCCIGGTGELLAFGEEQYGDESKVARWLGLDDTRAVNLFYPFNLVKKWGEVTRADAAKVIRHLAYTGEVNWKLVDG